MTQSPDHNPEPALSPEPEACALVAEHWPAVYRLMYRLTANPHDAEDLTQETFLRGLQHLDQFERGTNMRGWLLRIATNRFLDLKRQRRPVHLDEAAVEPAQPAAPVGADLEQREVAGHLQHALLHLSEVERAVFLLRATEDMPFRDIASSLGTTEVTARWHMLQARQRLLELLEGRL